MTILSDISDDQILTVTRENHFPDQNKLSFSVRDLLSVTENIIHDAAKNSIVDTFISPLSILKSISYQDLLQNYSPHDVPTLTTAKNKIPTAVYWTIYTIVACTAAINRITSDKDEQSNLPKLSLEKINELFKELKEQYDRCMKEAVAAKYLSIVKELATCDNITKVISTLIVQNDTVNQQPVISCDSNNNKIAGETFINELNEKYVLFYISSLENNISKEELLQLTDLYKRIDEEYKCKIVWIPIEDDWTTTEAEKKEAQFTEWRKMMPWYAVQYFPSASQMYLKKQWKVRGNLKAVFINPQGKVQNTNALTLIKEFGIKFFAFLNIEVRTMLKPVVDHITKDDHQLLHSMENQGYTFFIGGKNEKTTNELSSKIKEEKLAIEEELKIAIRLAIVTKDTETAKNFWFGIENLVSSLAHSSREYEYKQVTKELHMLLSYKLQIDKINGWIMLTKGWTVVTCGQSDNIFTTLKKFSDWKQSITGKEWECAFTKFHDSLITEKNGPPCITFEIDGNAPMHLNCQVCDDPMEIKLVKYNCCHLRLKNAAN